MHNDEGDQGRGRIRRQDTILEFTNLYLLSCASSMLHTPSKIKVGCCEALIFARRRTLQRAIPCDSSGLEDVLESTSLLNSSRTMLSQREALIKLPVLAT